MPVDVGKIDKNLVPQGETNRADAVFYNLREEPFRLYGLYQPREQRPYVRIPTEVTDQVNEGYTWMNRVLAGARARFATDSEYIILKVEVPSVTGYTASGTITAMKGFDLYIKNEKGIERYYASFRPPAAFESGYEAVLELPVGMKDITLYFPMYNQVNDVYVGLQEQAVLAEGSGYTYEKPIFFYGSSITQGCCVSRTGNIYSSVLGRLLDANTWNFGISGGAKGQLPTAEFIGQQDLSAFVYDYDHNAPNAEFLEATHDAFFQVVRAGNPTLPVVFVTKPDSGDPEREKRKAIIRATYEKAKAAGDEQVYFVDGENFFAGEEAAEDVCTSDGCHPNDFGYYKMAKGLEPVLREILKKE